MTHAVPADPADYPARGREGYEIQPSAAASGVVTARETPELRYMRETRNAVVFIAVIVGIVAVLALIGTIVIGVQLSHLNSQLDGGSAVSNCLSQGGTDPGC